MDFLLNAQPGSLVDLLATGFNQDIELGRPSLSAASDPRLAELITDNGLGLEGALEAYRDVVARYGYRVNHPRYLSYVPAAPSDAAVVGDLLVTLDNIYAGSREEASGAVDAENSALALLARLAGYPDSARGTFVSGGTLGNLSALAVARSAWRNRNQRSDTGRPLVLLSSAAHSSLHTALRVLDIEARVVTADDTDRLTAQATKRSLEDLSPTDRERVCALVASAGTTNVGAIDELSSLGQLAREHSLWFHVDAAYGGAVIFTEWGRELLRGLSEADSMIVDPHKWLFAPYDSCALIYRDPGAAVALFSQSADYLTPPDSRREPDPADLAPHLSRRARGVPLWMSLVAYGLRSFADSVMSSVALARASAELIDGRPELELLVRPELSVVMFRRVGWSEGDYRQWSMKRAELGEGFVVPTLWRGEPALRLCFVNPNTRFSEVEVIVGSLCGERAV
jgi:L-2,4-diaminobutyrate decarboxylase